MAVNKRLLQGAAAAAPGGLTPSEHFGVSLYEGNGSSGHSINGGKFGAGAYFNGSSSDIDVSNITLSDRSMSVWVKFNDVTKSYHTIYDTDQRTSSGHAFSDWTLAYYGINSGAKFVQSWGKHDGGDYEYGTFNFTASNNVIPFTCLLLIFTM